MEVSVWNDNKYMCGLRFGFCYCFYVKFYNLKSRWDINLRLGKYIVVYFVLGSNKWLDVIGYVLEGNRSYLSERRFIKFGVVWMDNKW